MTAFSARISFVNHIGLFTKPAHLRRNRSRFYRPRRKCTANNCSNPDDKSPLVCRPPAEPSRASPPAFRYPDPYLFLRQALDAGTLVLRMRGHQPDGHHRLSSFIGTPLPTTCSPVPRWPVYYVQSAGNHQVERQFPMTHRWPPSAIFSTGYQVITLTLQSRRHVNDNRELILPLCRKANRNL